MANLGDMVVSIVGDTTGLNKSLTESQKKMAAFGVNAAAIGAAVLQAAKIASKAVKDYTDYGSAIFDASEKTGLSTDALQEWKFIAEQSGGSLENITMAVKGLTMGLETNKETFAELGIELKNADGTFRSTTDIFNDTIATLSEMEDETQRDQMAFKLLGRSAQSLIPILNAGEAGIKGMRDEAHALGIVLDKEAISNADELGDSMDALKASMNAAKVSAVNEFAPMLISITSKLKEMIDKTVSARTEIDGYLRALAGTKLPQDKVADALKGTITEIGRLQAELKYLNPLQEYRRAQIEKEIEAAKALEQQLRAQAYAIDSAAAANALGTAEAKKKAEADAAAAEKSRIAAENAKKQADAQKELTDRLKEQNLIYDTALDERNKRIADAIGDQIVAEAEKNEALVQANIAAAKEIDEAWENTYDNILANVSNVFDSIIDLVSNLKDKQLEQLDLQLQAELEAAGVSEQTKVEELQAKYDAAVAAGDAELANELAIELKREQIKEDYAKRAATIEYEAALASWRLQLAQGAAQAAIAVINGLSTQPFIPAGIAAGIIAGGLGAFQMAAINAAKPSPPALAEGGIVMPTEGGTLAQIAEAGQPEAVIPLDKLGGLGGDIHLVVQMDSKPFLDKIFPATRDRTILISAGAVV